MWAPLRGVSPVLECVGGRARRARLPFIPGMVVVVVMIAPLKPRILYKREWEIDRQTIPLQGVGGWSMRGQRMPPLLYDPPELTEDAARVDPPMSAWPGAIRTPLDV